MMLIDNVYKCQKNLIGIMSYLLNENYLKILEYIADKKGIYRKRNKETIEDKGRRN